MSFKEIANGTLGKNIRKERDNQPDFVGSITLGGTKHSISVWEKVNAETNNKFYSFTVSRREEGSDKEFRDNSSPRQSNLHDDDKPF